MEISNSGIELASASWTLRAPAPIAAVAAPAMTAVAASGPRAAVPPTLPSALTARERGVAYTATNVQGRTLSTAQKRVLVDHPRGVPPRSRPA